MSMNVRYGIVGGSTRARKCEGGCLRAMRRFLSHPRTLAPSLLLLFMAPGAPAQSVEQWAAWGDAAFAKEEYYGASRFYAGALALEPGRMNLQWKQAEACRMSHQYPKAVDLYLRVYQKDAGRTHPDALRWLGEMQLCDERYEDARSTWTKVLHKEKDKGSVTAERARKAIAGCDLAGTTRTSDFQVEHLPDPVNTIDSEFGARTDTQGVLWFSSLRGELNDEGEVIDTAAYRIGSFSSQQGTQGWNEPEAVDPHGTANLMWAADGRAYFTAIAPDGTKHIATHNAQGAARAVAGLEAFPDATQPWATVIDGRGMLFFAATDGEGDSDIWYGEIIGDSLANIRNAGDRINSPGNEVTPCFDPTTGHLWFSSDFHAGLGGFDIFRSIWGGDGGPENVSALNSSANDLYPVYDAASGIGWLTSNRKGSFADKGETCCNDLYRFTRTDQRRDPEPTTTARTDNIPPRQEMVVDALLRMNDELPLKLYFHNDEPEPRSWSTTTRQTYGATFDTYRSLYPTYVSTNKDTAAIQAFLQQEAERGRSDLDRLVQALLMALSSGTQVTLEVRGHASPLARNDYNRNLSQRRIESLRNHLREVDNGQLRGFMDSTATNGGKLRLRALPFGEERAVAGVSDDIKALDRSVFSPEAARERRIEVERIVVEQAAIPLEPAMTFDMGIARQGEPLVLPIPVRNHTAAPLRIVRGTASCDCVTVEIPSAAIPPGGSSTFTLHYNGRVRPGPLVRTIDLEVEGTDAPFVLTILGNVTP